MAYAGSGSVVGVSERFESTRQNPNARQAAFVKLATLFKKLSKKLSPKNMLSSEETHMEVDLSKKEFDQIMNEYDEARKRDNEHYWM